MQCCEQFTLLLSCAEYGSIYLATDISKDDLRHTMGNLYTQDHFRLAVTEKGSVAESRGDCTLRLPDRECSTFNVRSIPIQTVISCCNYS